MKADLKRLIENVEAYRAAPSRPVYVLLYEGMLSRFILKDNALPKEEAEILSKGLPINHSRCNLRETLSDCVGISLDRGRLIMTDDKIRQDFKKIAVINKNLSTIQTYPLNPAAGDCIYLIIAKDGSVYKNTAHEDYEKTMLYRMMFLSENNFKHFELVYVSRRVKS